MWQSEFRSFLIEYCDSKRKGAGYFSYRKMSKKLSMSIGTLSDLINGVRDVSNKKALSILDKINDYDNLSRLDILQAKIKNSMQELSLIEPDKYDSILNWQSLGLCSALEFYPEGQSLEVLSDLLGLEKKVAEQRLSGLVAAKFVRFDSKKNLFYQLRSSGVSTDNIPNQEIRKSHIQSLERAVLSLDKDKVEERDFLKVIVTGDSKKIKKIKDLNRKHLKKVVSLLESSSMDQVYQISLQVVPFLTKPVRRKR